LQFGGGTLGHPGVMLLVQQLTACLGSCVQARNEGRNLMREGGDVIHEACKWSPEVAVACELWKKSVRVRGNGYRLSN